MKHKNILFLLFLLIISAMVWLFFRTKPPNTVANVQTNNLTEQVQSVEQIKSTVAAQIKASIKTNKDAGVSSKADANYVKYSSEQASTNSQSEWKHPIDFWGRVVDESNAPVVGARVHFEWNVVATDILPNGTLTADAISDVNGGFSLIGQHGKRLYVDVGKDGYYSSGDARNATFEYANPYQGLFTPDQGNPVVFHLRKKGEGESLVSRETMYGLKPDGTPQYLDLRTGNKTTGGAPTGDLMMQLTRTATDNPQRFNWTFVLQGISKAGLIESQDEFMFEAPESDYQNTVQQEEHADDYPYRNEIHKKYYVRLADGKTYARIETDLYVKYNQEAAVDINLYLNPTGSRNLEPKF